MQLYATHWQALLFFSSTFLQNLLYTPNNDFYEPLSTLFSKQGLKRLKIKRIGDNHHK